MGLRVDVHPDLHHDAFPFRPFVIGVGLVVVLEPLFALGLVQGAEIY